MIVSKYPYSTQPVLLINIILYSRYREGFEPSMANCQQRSDSPSRESTNRFYIHQMNLTDNERLYTVSFYHPLILKGGDGFEPSTSALSVRSNRCLHSLPSSCMVIITTRMSLRCRSHSYIS